MRRALSWLLALSSVLASAVRALPAHAAGAGGPVALEMRVTDQGPFGGLFGLALGYDRGGILAAGVGMGVGDYLNHSPPFGLFARARVLRLGRFAFGLEGAFSREYHTAQASTGLPSGPYDSAYATWTWDPSYRADVQAFAEASAGTWSFRIQAGAGMRVSQPDCAFVGRETGGSYTSVTAPCSEAPPAYGWDKTPDRVLRPVSLVVEHRFDLSPGPEAETGTSTYRAPETAYQLSLYATVLPVLAGSVAIATAVNRDHNDGGLMWLGVTSVLMGATFGPSTGYFYARDTARGIGHGFLRLLGITAFVGSAMTFMSENFCEYCRGSTATTGLLIAGSAAGIASLVSAVYDVTQASAAAERENRRRAQTALTVVPLLARTDARGAPGLAVAGRF